MRFIIIMVINAVGIYILTGQEISGGDFGVCFGDSKGAWGFTCSNIKMSGVNRLFRQQGL